MKTAKIWIVCSVATLFVCCSASVKKFQKDFESPKKGTIVPKKGVVEKPKQKQSNRIPKLPPPGYTRSEEWTCEKEKAFAIQATEAVEEKYNQVEKAFINGMLLCYGYRTEYLVKIFLKNKTVYQVHMVIYPENNKSFLLKQIGERRLK